MYKRELLPSMSMFGISLAITVLTYLTVDATKIGVLGDITVTPRTFPLLAGIIMLGASAAYLFFEVTGKSRRSIQGEAQAMDLKTILPVVIATIIYSVVLSRLGYVLSTVLITLFLAILFRAKLWQILIVSVLLPPLIYIVFKQIYVPLPSGIIGNLLG
jgi:hypothetical protein